MHEGLKKIHAGEFAWHAYFHAEVQSLLRKGVMPPIGEGFRRFLAAPSVVTSFENVLANEITEGKTEPYDSHPPLVERLAAIKKMPQGLNGHASESALELLENPPELEQKFLWMIDASLKEKTFTYVDWDDLGEKVTIPNWRLLVSVNAKILQAMTPESIPQQLKRLPAFAREIPDPPGELLNYEQSESRAVYLLGVSVGLRLLEQGWRMHAQPGDYYLYKGEEHADVVGKLEAITKGEMSGEQWFAQCEKWGIAGLSLA